MYRRPNTRGPGYRDPVVDYRFPDSHIILLSTTSAKAQVSFDFLLKDQATMSRNSFDSGANKESHGHQSVLTLWASKNDGKPARLPDGASEEEHIKWEKAMTEWALKGGADFV